MLAAALEAPGDMGIATTVVLPAVCGLAQTAKMGISSGPHTPDESAAEGPLRQSGTRPMRPLFTILRAEALVGAELRSRIVGGFSSRLVLEPY